MVKNFYIFRNGQSSYNLDGKIQGKSNDSVLTDKGISQALATASFLKDKNIEVIVSSPQRRAKLTGSIVAKNIKAPIQYDARFAEADLGKAEGLTMQQISKKYNRTLKKWQNPDSKYDDTCFANGETKKQLRSRILTALNEYADSSYQNIAVSGHNFAIVEALQSLKINKPSLANGEVVHLSYDNKQWKLVEPAQ